MEKSYKIFYHSDPDGFASGAILNLYLRGKKIFIPVDYDYEFPFNKVNTNDIVYIVDYSLPLNDFLKLLSITKNVIWIDHHKSAIDTFKKTKINNLKGIRKVGYAGCELTWKYCYPNKKIPEIIHRIGRFDVFDFTEYGDELHTFSCGLLLFNLAPTSINWKIFIEKPSLINYIITVGKVARDYRDGFYYYYITQNGFEAELDGYKCYCCNLAKGGLPLFYYIDKEKYDLFASFVWTGFMWKISLYTIKQNINCLNICKKYGGGGHEKACGFECETLPFTHIKKSNLKLFNSPQKTY